MKSGPVYRFGKFTLDVDEHNLSGPEGEIYLRPKTFETLRFLVERHGHLVTKDALFDSIWADVAVTDNALTRCIKELRKALDDDASDPQFLKTIPRIGYKFIAEVYEISGGSDVIRTVGALHRVSTGSDPNPGSQGLSVDEHGKHRGSLRRLRMGVLLALVAALSVVYLYLSLSHRDAALGFQARDWVLIADFDNPTQQRGLDTALRVILERELSLSRYVNYVPTGRVVDTLRLMKLDPSSTRLTEPIAREICLRDGGIRVLISGSIQQAGEAFQIALRLIDPSTGEAVLVFVEEAEKQDGILSVLRRLGGDVREALGESIESIAQSQAGLERVTTPSFSALELYSKGLRLNESARFTQAAAFFDQAISLDSEFASGYLIRALNGNVLGRDPGPDLQKATELLDTVTERERLRILLAEAIFVQHDVVRAMQVSQILSREYPDDYQGTFFRSYLLLVSDDWEGWLTHAENMQHSRPNDATLHFWKGLVQFMRMGDWEGAFSEAQRVLEINSQFPAGFPHFAGPCRDWMRGELSLARDGYVELLTSGMPVLGPIFQVGVRPFVSRFFFFVNDTEMALRLLETSEWMVPRLDEQRIAQSFRLERALIYEELGQFTVCRQLYRERADSNAGLFRIEALGWLGIHFAKNHEVRKAEAVRQELAGVETETPVGFFTPPVPGEREKAKNAFDTQIRGELAIFEGDIGKGIDCFVKVIEAVPPRGSVFASVLKPRLFLGANESLAQAYARLGRAEKSIEAYQEIIDHKGLIPSTCASGRIWLRALREIIPLLDESGQTKEAEVYRETLTRLEEWIGG